MELTRVISGISSLLLMLIVFTTGQFPQPFPPLPGLNPQPGDYTSQGNPAFPQPFIPSSFGTQLFGSQPPGFMPFVPPPFQYIPPNLRNPPDPRNLGTGFPNSRNPDSNLPNPQSPGPGFLNPQNPGSSFLNSQNPGSSFPNPQTPGSNFPSPQNSGPGFPNPQTSGAGFPNSQTSDSSLGGSPILDSSLPNTQNPGSSFFNPQNFGSTFPNPQNSDSGFPNPQNSGSAFPNLQNSGSAFNNPQNSGSSIPNPQNSDSAFPNPQSSGLSSDNRSSSLPKPSNSGSSSDIDRSDSVSGPQTSSSNPPISSGSPTSGTGPATHPVSISGSNSHSHRLRSSSKPPKDPLGGIRIVCLFNNKHFYRGGFTPALIDPSLCTHVNYEFAILDPKTYEMITGEPDLDIEENFYQEAIDLKKLNEKLKVLLSLGGWDDSTKKYSEMADDESKRKNFIEKAVSFLKGHEFDGMDLAWEYPNCWQGAIGISSKDKKNFVTLLQEMKPEFRKNGLILSVSVGAIKREIEAAYDVPGISDSVDYINVMTYDMHGPWESQTGHHTQFEGKPGDSDPDSNVKSAMKIWADKGADKKKLNLGLALYGKSFTLADPNDFKMGASAAGIGDPGPESNQGGFLLYSEICNFLDSGNWTEAEDKQAGYYAHYDDQWVCYDPPMMMVKKAKYVVEGGFGGVLLKDLSGDDYKGTCFSMTFPLLRMVKLEIIQKVKRLHRRKHHPH